MPQFACSARVQSHIRNNYELIEVAAPDLASAPRAALRQLADTAGPDIVGLEILSCIEIKPDPRAARASKPSAS
jgi:hypothetical protein